MVESRPPPSIRARTNVNIWSIFDLLAPACAVCGLPAPASNRLCGGCLSDLPRTPRPCCRCALPAHPAPGGCPNTCGRCRRRPPPVAHAIVACAYAFPVDRLVQQLKFGGSLPVARVLGHLLATAAEARSRETSWPLPQALVPVPLHAARERQRGFNQAEAIARTAGKALRIPVAAHAVVRCRDTRAQSGLDLRARRRNLRGAFRVDGDLPPHVAIVDDVVTTGNTVLALAEALRAHGVQRVDAWVVARTL